MRRSPFLWILLCIIGVAMALLLLRDRAPLGSDLDGGRIAQLVVLGIILVVALFGAIGRGALGQSLRYAVIWGLVIAVLLVGWTFRSELEWVVQRVQGELFPGTAVVATDPATGKEQVVVSRQRGGHFVLVATLNTAPIEMMVDTGASVVTLTPGDARLAGIETRNLVYRVSVQTANGSALAAPVILDSITIGSIERRRVAALVTQEGMLETSLLGLNFLSSLSSYTFAGGQLLLSP
ncbi:MAG: TIGR02281 family clan AA aspartic protease [Bauldia sp.]